MTTVELKVLLENPLVLFGAMYVATLLSAAKQIISARSDGLEVPTCVQYFARYWPETVTMVVGNAIAFAMLVATDTLNLASAVGIGYATNSLSDMLRKGGRSAAMSGIKKEGE